MLDINEKSAKIPHWLLFISVSFIIVFDLLYTYLFLSNNSIAYEDNPIHSFFVKAIGLNYFLIMIPISLIIVYGVILLGDWLIKTLDKETTIDGKNYVAIVLMLLTFPNVLINEIFYIMFGRNIFNWGFRESLFAGLVLTIIYIILAEIDDKSKKKQKK